MNIFFDEHRKLIADMLVENVEFMLIGGYAVNYHGYNRTTGDMDIWVRPDNSNKMKLINALKRNDVDEEDLMVIESFDFSEALVFSTWEIPYKIDFLTKVSGVTYEEADQEKIIAEVEGLAMPIINLHHLVLSKFGTGRPQDKTDIEKLQQIQKRK